VVRRRAGLALVLLLALFNTLGANADPHEHIVLASTTSTDNSGLFDYLLPIFEAQTGIKVHVVARGTGQAIRIAKDGDADILLVHHRRSEQELVAAGYALARHEVMYNDFVIVGPRGDPARINGMHDAVAALGRIAAARATFASRGDASGTHKAELALWRTAGIEADAAGAWYRETGSGMGATLNIAAGMSAYALVDRATWLAFRNKGDLAILAAGDPRLRNQYAVLAVNPARHPHVRAVAAQTFLKWLTGPTGQAAIADFTIDGEQLFHPNAQETGR
jgi:tungstate transport system substrate-binding protein